MFKVTIEEIKTVETTESKWVILEKRPCTKEEADNSYGSKEGLTKEVYGYAPPTAKAETKTTEIFSSIVNSIDLPRVILAVHNIDKP